KRVDEPIQIGRTARRRGQDGARVVEQVHAEAFGAECLQGRRDRLARVQVQRVYVGRGRDVDADARALARAEVVVGRPVERNQQALATLKSRLLDADGRGPPAVLLLAGLQVQV